MKFSLALTSRRQLRGQDTRRRSPWVDGQRQVIFSSEVRVWSLCGVALQKRFPSPHLLILLYFNFLYITQIQRDTVSASPVPLGPLQRDMRNRCCREEAASALRGSLGSCGHSCSALVPGRASSKAQHIGVSAAVVVWLDRPQFFCFFLIPQFLTLFRTWVVTYNVDSAPAGYVLGT